MGSNPISSIPPHTPTRCLVIAEAGTSHGGSIDTGKRLVEAAAEAGADCVKFQAVYAEEILHPLTGDVELPTGTVPLYQTFRELERDVEFYRRLKDYTEGCGLRFLCTPFGIRSARMLEGLGVTAYKIASPELNHFPLLAYVATLGKPVYLSTGVSRMADIERALDIVGELAVLVHCVTSYPAPEVDYNLQLLPNLRALLGVPVGVSDHSTDPILVPALAASLGAYLVEKHITLSNRSGGLDDPIALEPPSFGRMVDAVRDAESATPDDTRSHLETVYGEERVRAVLGDGVKRLAPSERSSYGRTNRSLHTRVALAKGQAFSADNVVVVRTEKRLRPGIGPEYLNWVLGRRASRDIPSGEGITWEDV